jgi:uncharacterized hydrophobic protein (TIGR00271 family)
VQTIATLIDAASLDVNYCVLIVASAAIATFGLLENSAAIIIGAMIIAPLMPVIQATAYGALKGSAPTFWRSVATLVFGVLIAVALSALLSRWIGLSVFGSEILSRTRPTLLDLGVALAAGAVGAYARVRPSIASSLAGTAIAVALLPPLCVIGIGVAAGDGTLARGALLLFTTNLLGITLASMFVFLVAGYVQHRGRVALAWTAGITALIIVPLTFGLQTLVHESAVENALRLALTTRTVTFRQATLAAIQFNWLSDPPTATLLVRASAPVNSHQVALLEDFAQHATGQRFRLVVDVSQIQRVTSAQYRAAQ